MKKHIFIILLMFFIHPNCLAGSTKDATKNVSKESPKNQNSIPLQLNKLQNNNKWQRFIQQKELNDINYDLYRIVGPNVDQSVIEHGAQDPYGYLVSKHNDTFCSRVIDPQCKVASPLYEYGDIRASLLLDQNLYKDQKEASLANEVTKNIINPFPSIVALEMRDANPNERNLPHNKVALAETLALQARLAVLRNSFNTMVLNRLPLDLLDGKTMATKESVSILSIMEETAKNRFESDSWQESIENANQDQLLKEMAKMESFKIWMEYHKFKQNERIEALLATMVAEQINLNQVLREEKKLNRQSNAQTR